MNYEERISPEWAKGLAERLQKMEPNPEKPYEHLVQLSLYYARKAQAYHQCYVDLGGDLKDYLADHAADRISHEFAAAIESLKYLSEQYEKISNDIWNSFEKKAIRSNKDDTPFINLLGAIYGSMCDEYRSCAAIICSHDSLEHKDDAASRLIWIENYFKGTHVIRILHEELENPGLVERYIESFRWRHK